MADLPETKLCIACAEPIARAAVKCKHCGSMQEKAKSPWGCAIVLFAVLGLFIAGLVSTGGESNDGPRPDPNAPACRTYADHVVRRFKACTIPVNDGDWETIGKFCLLKIREGATLDLDRCKRMLPTTNCDLISRGGFLGVCMDPP